MSKEIDTVAFLTRSPNRLAILRSLRRGSKDLRDLGDDLDAPRTTLTDNLSALAERGWVERIDGEYRVTALGSCVEDVLRDCRHSMRTAADLAPFLEYVPAGGLDVDVGRLHDSEVVTARFPRPYAPLNRFVEVVGDAGRLLAAGPLVTPVFDAVHEGVVERGLDAELFVTRDRYDTLRAEFGSRVEDGLATGRLRFGIREATRGYGTALVDDALVLGGLDEDGLIRAIVETDSPTAVDWGESVFREHRDAVAEFVE